MTILHHRALHRILGGAIPGPCGTSNADVGSTEYENATTKILSITSATVELSSGEARRGDQILRETRAHFDANAGNPSVADVGSAGFGDSGENSPAWLHSLQPAWSAAEATRRIATGCTANCSLSSGRRPAPAG